MNLKNYVDLEVEAAQLFLKKRNIQGTVLRNNEDNKKAVDLIFKIKDRSISTEVKIEDDWPFRTGNLTFDSISVFHWLSEKKKISTPAMLKDLKPYIKIVSYGTTFRNDYDVLLKWIRDTKTNRSEFLCYDACFLREKQIWKYLSENYPLRINPKRKYGLDDTWESAFWTVPIKDPLLSAAQI